MRIVLNALAAIAAAWLGMPLAGQTLPPPITDAQFTPVDPDEARLGRLLFWDPVLSGNRNISCASCHHPRFGTSDGIALSLGEGGRGLGPDRVGNPKNMPEQRVPRNSPALFNLGAREFTALFHDGRIEVDRSRPSGLRTPLGEDMVQGFANLLSAQTMFPVLSPDEMAGHYSENDISKAVRTGQLTGAQGAWNLIAGRVAAIPQYRRMFDTAYPEIAAGRPIAFTDISNAIAAFIALEWRSDDSPFDAVLRGEAELRGDPAAGMALFYGKAGCAACHSGPFQTDHEYHAMGLPQIGPGKAARFESHARDVGRMRVTGRAADAYAFRTPSLRNVMATGPYGHDGAFSALNPFLRAHTDPVRGMAEFDRQTVLLPQLPGAQDWRALDDPLETKAIIAAARPGPVLSDAEIAQISAFLTTLTDPVALGGRLGIPETVPSGLPVER